MGKFRSRENAMITDETRIDKGYSWVACIMGFVIQCLIAGQNNCSGIIFAALLDEYKTNRGQTGKAKFRVQCFFFFFSCPLIPLMELKVNLGLGNQNRDPTARFQFCHASYEAGIIYNLYVHFHQQLHFRKIL